mmetsp:Transcript_102845/g.286381  ORF Transcript_102845/g.286381 Transcript_102845/m.286381 type:complete len:408 (-) Transcript_102845:2319-3542(-)
MTMYLGPLFWRSLSRLSASRSSRLTFAPPELAEGASRRLGAVPASGWAAASAAAAPSPLKSCASRSASSSCPDRAALMARRSGSTSGTSAALRQSVEANSRTKRSWWWVSTLPGRASRSWHRTSSDCGTPTLGRPHVRSAASAPLTLPLPKRSIRQAATVPARPLPPPQWTIALWPDETASATAARIESVCGIVGGWKFGTGTKMFCTPVPWNHSGGNGDSSVSVMISAMSMLAIARICWAFFGVEETATSSNRKEKFRGSSTSPRPGVVTLCLSRGLLSFSRRTSRTCGSRGALEGRAGPSCAFFQVRVQVSSVWRWPARTYFAMLSANRPSGNPESRRTTKPSGVTLPPTADGSEAQPSRQPCSCAGESKRPRKTVGAVGRPSSCARARTSSQESQRPWRRAAKM